MWPFGIDPAMLYYLIPPAATAACLYFLRRRQRKKQQRTGNSGAGSPGGQAGSNAAAQGETEEQLQQRLLAEAADRIRQEKQREEQLRLAAIKAAQEAEQRNVERKRRNELLERVVHAVDFSTRELVTDTPQSGTQPRTSLTPTSYYNVRPIQSLSEIRSILPSGYILDDDQFYPKVINHQILVGEFQEFFGKAKKALVAMIDCSGSMREHGRSEWAFGLCDSLIDKCIRVQAEMILITFYDKIRGSYHVHNMETADKIRSQLSQILHPDGDTSIDLALETGLEVIKKEKFSEARMLLVTDGTQTVDVAEYGPRLRKGKIHLHTVCIAGDLKELEEISNRYDLLVMNRQS